MDALIIAGAGGFGREVYWLVEEINRHNPAWDVLGFLDDDPEALRGVDFPARVLGPIDSYASVADAFAVCAMGSPKTRKQVVQRMGSLGAKWATLAHPTTFFGTGSSVGEGCIFFPYAGITVNVTVGRHVTFNNKAVAGHDVTIGDFCTLSSLVDVNGQAALEEGVFLGSHAVVLPKARVGAWAQVGAGSVVLRRVDPETTVMGVPAKPIRFS